MNSYIQPNLSSAEAADIDLAVAAIDAYLTSYAGHSTSDVSISDNAEGNIKAILGEEISDVVEALAPTATMATATLAATVSSLW